jgi:hypothetical protein
MFYDNIDFLKQIFHGILSFYQLKHLVSGYSNSTFNVAGKRVAEFGAYKENIMFISIQSRKITSSLKDLRESARSRVRLEPTSDKRVLHKSTLADKEILKIFFMLFTSLLDIKYSGDHIFHVFELLFVVLGLLKVSKCTFPLIVFSAVEEEYQNTTTLIFRRNIMAHVGHPIVGEKPVSGVSIFSPERFFKNGKSLQSIRPQLIVKDDSFVLRYVGKINVSNDLERSSTNYSFCKHFKGSARFLQTSNYG